MLITVVAYPLPSRSYDELVCTAGITEEGKWIRIYPVPLSFLKGIKREGKASSYKYNWIEINLIRNEDDFRPETYSPVNHDLSDIRILGHIKTNNCWTERKKYCLRNLYDDMDLLIDHSKRPKNVSLATFKPTEITDLEIVPDDREWKSKWVNQRNQLEFDFTGEGHSKRPITIDKLPHKFYYHFKDSTKKNRKLTIEDWEIGALYWNCLSSCNGNETIAKEKVKARYLDEFVNKCDPYFFVGTTLQWHKRRSKNPFVIIGVFYPRRLNQIGNIPI